MSEIFLIELPSTIDPLQYNLVSPVVKICGASFKFFIPPQQSKEQTVFEKNL